MKNLKRLGTLLLALVLMLSLTIPAFAVVDDTGFSDVDAMRGTPRRSCTARSIT